MSKPQFLEYKIQSSLVETPKYDLLAMPVVDDKKVVKGVITVDDILALAIDEAWGEKPGLL